MRRVLAVLFLALSLGIGACGIMPSAAPNLDGTEWIAVLVAERQPAPGREPSLRFASGKVTGSGGCNPIGGEFRTEGDRIKITALRGDLMGCPAPIGEIEGLFMNALSRAEIIRLDGSSLVIGGPGGEIVLVRSLGG